MDDWQTRIDEMGVIGHDLHRHPRLGRGSIQPDTCRQARRVGRPPPEAGVTASAVVTGRPADAYMIQCAKETGAPLLSLDRRLNDAATFEGVPLLEEAS